MADGIPVVIAANGNGFPVKSVTSGAPLMTVAASGIGAPIILSDLGAPFIVQGASEPTITYEGSGYAGSVYTSTVAGQWYADGVEIAGATGSTWTMTLEYEGAAIKCGDSNVIQMWVPTSALFSAVFDVRKNITLSGSSVTAWGSSVNGVVASQDAAASQPVYIPSPPSIEFTNDFLVTQSAFPGSGGDISVVGMAKWDGDGGAIMAGSEAGTYILARRTTAEGGKLSIGADGAGFILESANAVPLGSAVIFSAAIKSQDNYVFRMNGSEDGSGSTTMAPNNDGVFRIGRIRTSGRFFNGLMSSILISRTMLSLDNTTKTEGWIAHTLNVASLLPSGHPYKTASPRVQ